MRWAAAFLQLGFLLLAVSVPFAAAQDLAILSRTAKQAMDAGRFREAAAIYEKMTAALPDNTGLRMNLGLALFSAGDYVKATTAFLQTTKMDRNMQPAWLLLGLTFQKRNLPEEAIAPLVTSLNLKRDDPKALFELGDAYLRSGHPDLAVGAFKQLPPNDPLVLLGLGSSYLEMDSARPLAEIRFLRAARRVEQKRWTDAFVLFRQALKINPTLAGAHTAIAGIYRATGHADWADHEAKLEATAAGAPPASGLGAVIDQLRALPDSAALHQLLAQVHEAGGDQAEAAAQWRLAARLAPKDGQARAGLARTLWRDRKYEEAKPLLESLVADEPGIAQWHYLLGYLYFQLEQIEKARPKIETAIRMEPGNLAAKAVLGRIFMQLGDTAKAIPPLQSALSLDEDGSLHYQLALAFKRTGRTEEAAALMAKYKQFSEKPAEVPAISAPVDFVK